MCLGNKSVTACGATCAYRSVYRFSKLKRGALIPHSPPPATTLPVALTTNFARLVDEMTNGEPRWMPFPSPAVTGCTKALCPRLAALSVVRYMYTVLSTDPALLPSPEQAMGALSRSVAESAALHTPPVYSVPATHEVAVVRGVCLMMDDILMMTQL